MTAQPVLPALIAGFLAIGLYACSFAPVEPAGPSVPEPPPAVEKLQQETVEAPAAVVAFLDRFDAEAPSEFRMTDYQTVYDDALNVYRVDNGTFRIALQLDGTGKVTSALYQDGLDESGRKKVAAILADLISGNAGLGSLEDDAKSRREENGKHTQDLVDAIDQFQSGKTGDTPSAPGGAELSMPELEDPEPFTQDDLKAPETSKPASVSEPSNPNSPDLPEIGNFGKLP